MKRAVRFNHSDIGGHRALLISVENSDGTLSSVKLTADECEEALEVATSQSAPYEGDDYSSIRQCLGHFIGRTIEDITQHDEDEWNETHRGYMQLLLSGGGYIKCFIGGSCGIEYEDLSERSDKDGQDGR